MSRRHRRKSSSSRSVWPRKAPSVLAARAEASLSDGNANGADAGAQLWTAPDMGSPVAARKMATVGGLVDLQAEAHKEAFEQGLDEGREAGRADVRAQVQRLAGMFYDLAKPFEVLDTEVERELLA